jgi:hypothetical protein
MVIEMATYPTMRARFTSANILRMQKSFNPQGYRRSA